MVRWFSRLILGLRRPRVWATVLLLGAVLALGGPYLWAVYSWNAAERALAQHRPADASQYLESCLRTWPRSPEVQLLAARAARRTEDYDAAHQHLTECQRLERAGGKESEASVLEWALLRAEVGDVDAVEGFLVKRAMLPAPQSQPVLEALAAGYLRMYRFFDAMRCLEQCLQQDPGNLRALFLRGQAWERVHAYPKAAADYEQVVVGDPGHDAARLRLANSRLENGEPARAVSHLEHLRRRQPDNPEVLVRLAYAWNATGRLVESIQLIDDVLAQHPELPSALSARGQLAFQAEKPAEAEAWLRRALAHNRFDRAAHFVLQQCLEQQGRREEAAVQKEELRKLEETITRLNTIGNRLMPKSPRDPALHHELGTILLQLGNEQLGVGWFHSALRHDPDYLPAHKSLADYYERVGDRERAATHRERAAKLEKSSANLPRRRLSNAPGDSRGSASGRRGQRRTLAWADSISTRSAPASGRAAKPPATPCWDTALNAVLT